METMHPSLKISRILSIATFLLGLILIIYMVTVEGELGALPLALMLGGAIWTMVVNHRIKSNQKG